MVFEQLYSIDFLTKNPWYALLLGIGYSVFGIAIAIFTFPKDPALVAVAIISILLLPSLYKFSAKEESVEGREKKFTFKELLKDNRSFLLVYLLIFIGVMLTFAFFAIALPSLAGNHLFKTQLEILYGTGNVAGNATFTTGLFTDIFFNNFKVLLICFLISLIAGNGAIFLIVWNGSVWGTIFGVTAWNCRRAS